MAKREIHNPHDKALFNALKNYDVARDAMKAYLPSEILQRCCLEEIKPYKAKLISSHNKAFQADVIYELPFEEGDGLVIFHCEHQSTVEKFMPLRVWQYILLILMEYAENHPKNALPVVYPIIIYTGERPYYESTHLFDLFGANRSLSETILLQKIKLIDVCRMNDEDILKHRLFGLSEYAFKYKKTKDFEAFLDNFLPWLQEVLEFNDSKAYAKMILKYVIEVFPDGSYEKLINYQLSKDLGSEAMTIAQELRQEGRKLGLQEGRQMGVQEGRQMGVQEGRQTAVYEVAKRMLLNGFSIKEVCKITQLSTDAVQALANE